MSALGKALEPAYRSKLERDYAIHLDVLLRAGAIRAWWFETTTFKLGHDCRLTPDFQVQLNDLSIEYHETKGFRRDDAMAKLRVVASQQPFVFRLVTRSKEGAWEICEVGSPAKKDVPGSGADTTALRGVSQQPKHAVSRRTEAGASAARTWPCGHLRRLDCTTACDQVENRAWLNGKPISMDAALKMVRGE